MLTPSTPTPTPTPRGEHTRSEEDEDEDEGEVRDSSSSFSSDDETKEDTMAQEEKVMSEEDDSDSDSGTRTRTSTCTSTHGEAASASASVCASERNAFNQVEVEEKSSSSPSEIIITSDVCVCSEVDLVQISNTFPLLPSYLNNPLTLEILTYLTAMELLQLAPVSRGVRYASTTPLLWKMLLQRDFNLKDSERMIIDNHGNVLELPLCKLSSVVSCNDEAEVDVSASKSYYIFRRRTLKSRISIARSRSDGFKKVLRDDKKIMRYECCLDFTLLRFFLPFFLASLFSSMLLVAMWIDGTLSTNVFVGLSPLLAFILYVVVCFGINFWLYRSRNANAEGSFLANAWSHVRGPLQFLYVNVFDEHNVTVAVSLISLALLLAQIVLLGFKLSGTSTMTDYVDNILQWELVFAPTWLLFLLFLIAPCLGCINVSLFVVIFIFLWIPFFVFFVCLSLKLKGMENETKTRNLSLALILIPFWIFEGGMMMATLLAVIEIVYRLRRDLRAYFSLVVERLGMYECVTSTIAFPL
jgi:hypothetical protein